MSKGLLIIWTDVEPSAEADFNDWYDHQHLEERVGVPGFINGRRYSAIDGRPRYLAWYETDTPDVLGSVAYGERQANPTPWTQRIMPNFRNVTRVTAEQIAKSGEGIGGWCTTLRFRPKESAKTTLFSWLTTKPDELVNSSKVVSALSWRPADADAAKGTTEAELRKNEEQPPAWGLLIETGSLEAAQRALVGLAETITSLGGGDVETGYYRLGLLRIAN